MVHMARVVDSRGAYKILMGRSERRRPFERQGFRREDNKKMHPKFLEDVDWTYSENLPALDDRSCRFGFSKVIRIYRLLKKDYAPWSELCL